MRPTCGPASLCFSKCASSSRAARAPGTRVERMAKALRHPSIGLPIVLFFLSTVAWSQLEPTAALLAHELADHPAKDDTDQSLTRKREVHPILEDEPCQQHDIEDQPDHRERGAKGALLEPIPERRCPTPMKFYANLRTLADS